MNKEEKAKAYDEALEKARIAYNKITPENTAVKKLLEESFPELKESEDEEALRIIKKRMCYDPVPISDEDRRIVENWLEKQKAQEPITDSVKFEEGFKLGREYERREQKERGPLTKEEEYELHRIIEFLEDETCPSKWISLLHDISCLPYEKYEKQKEQKESLSERFRPDFPTVADFIESVDELEKNKAIEILEDYLKWAVSSEGECRYTWKELANAIQLGIDTMKEQKPVERWQYVGKVDLEKNKEEQKPVEIHIDNPNIQKIDPDVKISTSDSSASGDELLYVSQKNIELIQKSWYMEGYNDREYNKEPKWIIKTGEGGPRYEENPKYGKLIEKKSAKWKPQPESLEALMYAIEGKWEAIKPTSYLSRRLEELYKGLLNAYNVEESDLTKLHETALTGNVDELEELKNKIKASMDSAAPKKQDYSGLNDFERAIHRGFLCAGVENVNVNIIKETAQECLAHLKPVEWSEEDEQGFGNTLWAINQANTIAKDVNAMGTCMSAETWLESLRSRLKSSDNWKPSEEQMNALSCAIADVARFSKRGGRQVELENEPYYSALHSLYCNLEKLM